MHYKKMTFASPVPFLAQGGGRVSGLAKRVLKQCLLRGDPVELKRILPRPSATLRGEPHTGTFCTNGCVVTITHKRGHRSRVQFEVVGI